MKRLLFWVVVILLAALAVAVIISYQGKRNQYIPLRKVTVSSAVYGIGTVSSNGKFELKTGVAAAVEKRFVQDGDKVRKDDPLVKLVGFPMFRAPHDGIVTQISVENGENVPANSALLILTDPADLFLKVRLEQEAVAKVREGQIAKINFDAFRNQPFEGIVQKIYADAGGFFVHVSIQEPSQFLLPGMTADVGIEVSAKRQVFAVPFWALTSKSRITLRRKNQEPRTIAYEIGSASADLIEIRAEGLSEEDELVTQAVEPSVK